MSNMYHCTNYHTDLKFMMNTLILAKKIPYYIMVAAFPSFTTKFGMYLTLDDIMLNPTTGPNEERLR